MKKPTARTFELHANTGSPSQQKFMQPIKENAKQCGTKRATLPHPHVLHSWLASYAIYLHRLCTCILTIMSDCVDIVKFLLLLPYLYSNLDLIPDLSSPLLAEWTDQVSLSQHIHKGTMDMLSKLSHTSQAGRKGAFIIFMTDLIHSEFRGGGGGGGGGGGVRRVLNMAQDTKTDLPYFWSGSAY